MQGDWGYQVLSELKDVKGLKDSRSVAIRKSRKAELRRLGIKIPRGL